MKRISYYLVFIVLGGSFFVSYWVWQKYFKIPEEQSVSFTARVGDLTETIKVRGEVAAQKDYNLEFPFSGTIENIFVAEGDNVSAGAALMKLETIDFKLEADRLKAILNQQELTVQKLIAGPTVADIKISETKVVNARFALSESKKNVIDKIKNAYSLADDAIHNRIDPMFLNPIGSSPRLRFIPLDSKLVNDLEGGRPMIETILTTWQASAGSLMSEADLVSKLAEAKKNLDDIKLFLDSIASAVNSAGPSFSISQATIDTWRADTYTARSNINTSNSNIVAAEEKLKTAESVVALAEDEFVFKKAGSRTEDIEIAKSTVQETKSQLDAVEEKIRKSTLYAPIDAKVVKTYFERQELFRPGVPAISLSTASHKIQADVSELDIGKIRANNTSDVDITLDSFSQQKLTGRVVSVDPQEIIKEGDKYYRVNISLDAHGMEVRPGMSADLVIKLSTKKGIVYIPEIVVYEKDNKRYVMVRHGDVITETPVDVGISDGEYIEITKGIAKGDIVIVPKL